MTLGKSEITFLDFRNPFVEKPMSPVENAPDQQMYASKMPFSMKEVAINFRILRTSQRHLYWTHSKSGVCQIDLDLGVSDFDYLVFESD